MNRLTQEGEELYANNKKIVVKKDAMNITLLARGSGTNTIFYLCVQPVGTQTNGVASTMDKR